MERIELRVTPWAKRALQAAADASHQTLSDFVLESALAWADSVLADRQVFQVNAAEQWRAFLAALDAPPKPRPRLARLLKKPSILVNVARAQIVNERDLYDALKENVLHAAGQDVWYRYPKHPEGIVPGYFEMPEEAKHTFPSEYPFHELDNLVMSPHRGGASAYAEKARIEHLARLIEAKAITGQMPNKVDLDAGY